ncbi:hypothetical protein Droror1_Dr00017804 [Drosera rotundifolia]
MLFWLVGSMPSSAVQRSLAWRRRWWPVADWVWRSGSSLSFSSPELGVGLCVVDETRDERMVHLFLPRATYSSTNEKRSKLDDSCSLICRLLYIIRFGVAKNTCSISDDSPCP